MNDIDNKIAELEAETIKLKASRRPWLPDYGQDYWSIEGCDIVSYKWAGDGTDRRLWDIGNVFSSFRSAEQHFDRLIVAHRLKVLSAGFVPDWTNDSWTISFDGNDCFPLLWTYGMPPNTLICFPTKSDAERAIDALGDDIKYLFDGDGA